MGMISRRSSYKSRGSYSETSLADELKAALRLKYKLAIFITVFNRSVFAFNYELQMNEFKLFIITVNLPFKQSSSNIHSEQPE